MTTGMGQSFSYDGANRLKEVGTGGANVYGYDGDGKRVKKTEGGTTTYYVYSSKLGQSVMEVNTNSVQRAYVYSGGKVVAMQATDGQFYWLHTNHLGNSRAMTDGSGNLTYKGQFDPYGATLTEWSGSGNTNLNSKKFTGYERDSATGLDYAQARMYNSSRGRFMTPDPIGLKGANHKIPQSLNRYSYVQNDPVNATDPTGEFLSYCGWGIWEQIVFGIASSGICSGGGWWGGFDYREAYAKLAPVSGRSGGGGEYQGPKINPAFLVAFTSHRPAVTSNKCGRTEWNILWHIATPNPEGVDGLVIQHVKGFYEINGQKTFFDFFEAWEVRNGIVMSNGGHDSFGVQLQEPAFRNSGGNFQVVAYAKFIRGAKLIPSEWDDNIAQAGGLPSRAGTRPPPFWTDEDALTRSMSVSWICTPQLENVDTRTVGP
jgi:RHS repeat-associated protein